MFLSHNLSVLTIFLSYLFFAAILCGGTPQLRTQRRGAAVTDPAAERLSHGRGTQQLR